MVKRSTWLGLGVLAVGAGALYYYFLPKEGNVGGSLAQQAFDSTVGQIIGAPSRAGSVGTIGAVGSAWQDIGSFSEGIKGTPSVAGGIGTPSLLSQLVAGLSTSFNNLIPIGSSPLNPLVQGNNQYRGVSIPTTNTLPSAATLSAFTASPVTPQASIASSLGLRVSQINPAVNTGGTPLRIVSSSSGAVYSGSGQNASYWVPTATNQGKITTTVKGVYL